MTIAEILLQLERRCAERGDAIALHETTGRTLSFRELWAQVANASERLIEEGMQPGDHVLFAVRPRIESIVLILAIARAGGVIVALDTGMGEELFASRMRTIRPTWMMAESTVLAFSSSRRVRALVRWRGIALPDVKSLGECKFVRVGPRLPMGPRSRSFAAITRTPASPQALPERSPNDPAFIVFTSGTTDAPKAVAHTGGSIGATLAIAAEHLALSDGDVVHAAELHLVLPALLAGVKTVIPRRRFAPARFLRDLEEHRITHTFGLPAEFQKLTQYCMHRNRTLPSRLRTVMLGAAPVYPAFLGRLRNVLPRSAAVWCVYAMTEMLPVCRVTLDEKLARGGAGDLVGRPFPGVSVRIEEGELLVRGPNLFRQYLGEAAVSEHRTGDAARIDADGSVVLLGRKKDMIIRGHHNVYPALYEPTIARIPGVRRCVLAGVYMDEKQDEAIVLAIEPDDGAVHDLESRVRAALRNGPHAIDASAQPDLIVTMEIPLAGRSQKVDMDALRDTVRARL